MATIWRGLKWIGRLISRAWAPAPQPQQFVGTAIVGGTLLGFVLKSLIVAVPLSFATYYAGSWIGELRGYGIGYNDHAKLVAKTTEQANERIAVANEVSRSEKDETETRIAASVAHVAKSLTDISPEQRKQCSASCGLPASVKSSLEEIQ